MSDVALNDFIGKIDAFSFTQRLSILDALVQSLTVRKTDVAYTATPKKTYTKDDVKDSFGLWKEHSDSADVAAYVRALRKGRQFAI